VPGSPLRRCLRGDGTGPRRPVVLLTGMEPSSAPLDHGAEIKRPAQGPPTLIDLRNVYSPPRWPPRLLLFQHRPPAGGTRARGAAMLSSRD